MGIFDRVNNLFKRSQTNTLGAARDWQLWRSLFSSQNKHKINVNPKTSLEVPSFWRAVDVLSTQFAAIDFIPYRINPDDKTIEEARTHPLYKLLKYRPSPHYDTFTFRETIMRRLLNGSPKTSAGNVLVEIVRNSQGSVQELKIIDERYQVVIDDEMTYYDLEESKKLLRYDEVLHFKAWSFDGINGENPLVYLNNTFGRAISELRHAASFYGNGAQVDLILETEMPLNEQQRKIIEQSWEHKYSGPDSQGKTALLSHGVKAKPLGKGVSEADINSRKLTVEDISNITGVPLPLLGQIDGRYNLEFLNRLFVQYTLRGWCKRFEAEMNSKLFSDREMGRIEVRFDLSGLMQGDLQAQASFFREMYNIRVFNPNEIRQQLGKNPYEGGDRYGMPLASNSTEVPQQPTQPEPNTEEDAL